VTYTDPNAPDDQGNEVVLSRKQIRKLEEQAKEGREAKEQLAQLQRERSFVAAGVPLDDKRTPYFIAGYQGEQTPEAIKTEWQSTFGAPQGQGQQSQSQPLVEQELAQLNGAVDLTQGGGTIPPDRLAQRNAELAKLSDTDPRYDQKFTEIMSRYGSPVYNVNTG